MDYFQLLIADAELIEARYEAVEELLENVEMFTTLQSALVKFPDIERAITLSIQIPKYVDAMQGEFDSQIIAFE